MCKIMASLLMMPSMSIQRITRCYIVSNFDSVAGHFCNLQLLYTLQEWPDMVDKGDGFNTVCLCYCKAINSVAMKDCLNSWKL